ncbi:MAG: polysaccharide deacetylase family protein [Clostridiales bacterium]|nr:polysaccharide deacetylase family protein [Clostridiales bacterium]
MDIFMRFPGGVGKALTLSYDDGNDADFTLVDIIDRYGIKCTFNLNSARFKNDTEGRQRFEKLKNAYEKGGHEVAIHGESHAFMEQQPAILALTEAMHDREFFEKETGVITRGMAYPYGTWDKELIEVMKSAGIVYSRTTKATHEFDLPGEWLCLNPTCHHKDERLFELLEKFNSIDIECDTCLNKRPKMFYLWGHSYEFNNDNNWERLDEFSKKASGRDDTWYATNIEIYNYVKAYESLVFSTDGSIVQNPTAIDVWFYRRMKTFPIKDEKIIKAPAGECVKVF